jgi:hypothetical protein
MANTGLTAPFVSMAAKSVQVASSVRAQFVQICRTLDTVASKARGPTLSLESAFVKTRGKRAARGRDSIEG